jgi:hypothetical protein
MSCGCLSEFYISEGATLPVLRDTLTQGGEPIDLTAATVSLVAKHRDLGVRVTKTPSVVSPATDGNVDTTFATTDLQPGTYDYQYVVTVGATVVVVPDDGSYGTIVVTARL